MFGATKGQSKIVFRLIVK